LEPKWSRTVNLSIKNVPEDIVAKLRERAALDHRSLQGELLMIVKRAAAETRGADAYGVLEAVRRSGLSSPSESVQMIREDRDGR
jgi:plasmid stability protein